MKKVEFIWSLDLAMTMKECMQSLFNKKDISTFSKELVEIVDPGQVPTIIVKSFGKHNEDMNGFRLISESQNSLITAHFALKTKTIYINVHSCHPYQPSMALN